jgi:hypothetical protein
MPPAPNAAGANDVFDDLLAPTYSYLGWLNEAVVNIVAPPLDSFNFHGDEEETNDGEEADDEDVTKIEEGVSEAPQGDASARRPTIRLLYCTKVEDVRLVSAWSQVGLDAVTSIDQTKNIIGNALRTGIAS